jgi:hypothetical protein
MLSRKDHKETGIFLPESWCGEVENTLNDVYQDQKDKFNKSFLVYGLTYPDEFLLGVSFLGKESDPSLPITVFLSSDVNEGENSETLLKTLIDTVGLLFDEVFSVEDWNNYNANWQDFQTNKKVLYFLVSRENLKLTKMADDLLKKDFN